MTREEQLNKAAFDYVNQGGTTAAWSDGWEDFSDAEYVEEAFKAGAEWEHKRLVDKACEWLMATSNFYQGGSNALPEVICMFDTINEMVDSFRKEMADDFQKVIEE